MAKTVEEIQARLKSLGLYEGEVDGLAGKITSEAVVAFQQSKGLDANGKVDPATLAALFPSAVVGGSTTIKGKLIDYVVNFATSKINAAAAVLVGFLATWVYTKFGLQLSPEIKDAITVLIASAGGGLILVLRTFFNSPHMTNKQPAVVKQPAEHN